ncbi:MAG: nucleotide exchange factor GrpE [Lachnospiraceae bacterium]|nr:nucleotide exchange factor GrpE [Lachnospiraceae bacterium]
MEENKDLQDQNTDIEKDIENAADETSVEFEEAAEENIEENVESETTDDSEKKGFSKKKKDKKDELIEELTDKYKRTFAEFDNFRKRSEKEKSAMYGVGAMDVIGKILPVVDNFERGLNTLSDEEREAPFADGMDKIYKQLLKSLEDLGVSEIEALGKEFDPNLHNAVMHIDDEELGDNVVAEVLQKGYMYKDSVVRHSMVKVAN